MAFALLFIYRWLPVYYAYKTLFIESDCKTAFKIPSRLPRRPRLPRLVLLVNTTQQGIRHGRMCSKYKRPGVPTPVVRRYGERHSHNMSCATLNCTPRISQHTAVRTNDVHRQHLELQQVRELEQKRKMCECS